ncbi:MAG: gamma-glutamyl-gamma-aminobutyrate hydrolase family protein [Clostridia bacterium]
MRGKRRTGIRFTLSGWRRSRLAESIGESQIRVNSSHHQAVRESREDRYRVSGRAEDLAVEAIEMCDLRFWIGVQ